MFKDATHLRFVAAHEREQALTATLRSYTARYAIRTAQCLDQLVQGSLAQHLLVHLFLCQLELKRPLSTDCGSRHRFAGVDAVGTPIDLYGFESWP